MSHNDVLSNSSVPGLVDATAERVGMVLKTLGGKERSLLDYAKKGRIEPHVIIDATIRYNPNMKDLLQTMTTLFSGIYLQAIKFAGLVDNVSIMRRLDQFNPARSIAMESIDTSFQNFGLLSLEAYNDGSKGKGDGKSRPELDVDGTGVAGEVSLDLGLAVGKVLSLKLSDGSTVPVTVGLLPVIMQPEGIEYLLARGSRYNSGFERFWRAWYGDINWISDWALKMDLTRDFKRAINSDKSGVIERMENRRTNNLIAALVSGKESIATASAMMVVSANTMVQVERKLGGKLSSDDVRDTMFEMTGLMMLVVYDPKWERFTFWLRDQPEARTYQLSEIKAGGKKSNGDITALVEALMQNNIRNI